MMASGGTINVGIEQNNLESETRPQDDKSADGSLPAQPEGPAVQESPKPKLRILPEQEIAAGMVASRATDTGEQATAQLEEATGDRDALNAEDLAVNSNVTEANELLTAGRAALSDSFEGTLTAGRAFNALKPMFKKGTWLARLELEASRSGHSVRSIQEYMKAAKEADAKNAKLRAFAKATDKQSLDIKAAGEQAEKQVEAAITANELVSVVIPPPQNPTNEQSIDIEAGGEQPEKQVETAIATNHLTPDSGPPQPAKPRRKSPPLGDGNFNLPLHLTGKEKEASKQLLVSQNWPGVQKHMTATWRRLLVQYGYVVEEAS